MSIQADRLFDQIAVVFSHYCYWIQVDYWWFKTSSAWCSHNRPTLRV